jgi:hypothetical protein
VEQRYATSRNVALIEPKRDFGIAALAGKCFTRESRNIRMTFDEIVNDYILQYRKVARQEMRDAGYLLDSGNHNP